MITVGQKAPDFSLPAGDGTNIRLRDFKGKSVVVFFYPKDNTPGCTREACDFRDNFARLKKLGVVVIGISPDSPTSHRAFANKHKLPFLLLSDEGKEVAKAFGVWKKKKLYGREFMGIVRTTFLIDPRGTIVRRFDNVRVARHVDQLIESLKHGG
ncbi:MAG: thioredoxin-dependent thiol peroxidase [Ignavibacteria bacterium]|nr:thioredoxin-dependent thiol peroxidase [Ignavibacteria bacterium]